MKIPLIASGGIAGARGFVAALALGAEGVDMVTRFCATREAPIHPNLKQAYPDDDERGTHLIFRRFHNTARMGKSAVSDEVVRISAESDATFADVQHLVPGAQARVVIEHGVMSAGIFGAGMTQGLIRDLPTVKELIERIIGKAEAIIRRRLGGKLADDVLQPA